MLRRFAIMALATIVCGGTASAGETQPYQTMRAMQRLEDRIAAGDAVAQAARAKAVMRLGHVFVAMPAETWRDLRNARALVAYLFSGGDGATLAGAIPPEAVHKDATALYQGALAYSAGDDDGARGLLLPLDAKALPSGLAGHLALVQAALVEPTDKPKAVALLDLARLLEPGTLVEEAALRKEMTSIGETGDFDKLILLERRYQAAFARSVYAENFKRLVAMLALKSAEADDTTGNERLARLTAPLSHDDRRRLLLAVARQEVLAGHLVSAPFAALEGARLSDRDVRDAARAQLYYGASALAGPSYDKAMAALAAAAPEHLDARDRNLRLAALDMAATMHAASGLGPIPPSDSETALLADGDRALGAANSAIRSAKK